METFQNWEIDLAKRFPPTQDNSNGGLPLEEWRANMNLNCEDILKWTEAQLKYTYDVSLKEATPQELHEALGQAVMMAISDNWSRSKKTRMH